MTNRKSKFAPILLLSLAFTAVASAQTLQVRLDQQTDFVPKAGSPVEQLIEVAKRFQIPMGIEWLEQNETDAAVADKAASSKINLQQSGNKLVNDGSPIADRNRQSVLDLIRAIVRQSPAHEVLVEDRLVHVFAHAAVVHPFNFLNLPVDSFFAGGESLYGAQHYLSLDINMTLHPELYRNGYGGGYGGVQLDDPDGLFYIKNITFSGRELTIREILNEIAIENGNALWVVRLRPDELTGDEPHWKRKGLGDSGRSPLSGRWQFIPLAGLSQLAKEQVTVELTIAGFFTAKQFIFPVIMEHGLGRRLGSGNGIGSSDGSHCNYSVALKDVRRDAVTVHVSIAASPIGKAETVFDKEIEVARGKVTEQQVGDAVLIRARIEARQPDPQ